MESEIYNREVKGGQHVYMCKMCGSKYKNPSNVYRHRKSGKCSERKLENMKKKTKKNKEIVSYVRTETEPDTGAQLPPGRGRNEQFSSSK